jgi:hypothetical protein
MSVLVDQMDGAGRIMTQFGSFNVSPTSPQHTLKFDYFRKHDFRIFFLSLHYASTQPLVTFIHFCLKKHWLG